VVDRQQLAAGYHVRVSVADARPDKHRQRNERRWPNHGIISGNETPDIKAVTTGVEML